MTENIMRTDIIKMYAACPKCAHKLCKGENGSAVEIVCPRCSTIVRIVFQDNQVQTIPLESQKKRNK